MANWLMGLVVLALTHNPVVSPDVDLSWVPTPTAGVRLPALTRETTDRALVRKPWCDFGKHAQRYSKGGNGADAVFRRPSAEARATLNEIRESILNPTDYASPAAAEARFGQLAQTVDGPALIRLTIQDADPRIERMALRASKLVVALQPRLAAFATGYLTSADPELAIAAVDMHFASGCDTAAQYALDGFRHPLESVQLATLRAVYEFSRNHENLRLADRILQFIAEGKGTPRARFVALRLFGHLGLESTAVPIEALLTDKQDAVAAESLATLAIVSPGLAEKYLKKWLKDKSPLKRAGAMRAIAQVYASRREVAEPLLRPLLNDTTPLPDAFGLAAAPGKTLGEVARAALAYIVL